MQKMHDRKNIGKIVLDPAAEPKPKPPTPAKIKAKKEKKEKVNLVKIHFHPPNLILEIRVFPFFEN